MRKLLAVGCTLGFVVLLAAVLGALAFLGGGIGTRAEPGALETTLSRRARSFMIPGDAREQRNPLPADERALSAGRAHFADHCASCHANDGSGRTSLGQRLYPRAPDMRLPATQDLTDGELFHIIENGVRLTGMPGWGADGRSEESWQLVHFIRHLPALTPPELAEMERLNPRSPAEWRAAEEDERFLRGENPPPPRPSSSHAR